MDGVTEILEPPRWPGGPPICAYCNLPAFETWDAATKFNDENGSKQIQVKWHCTKCHCWHYWSKETAPAGQSSGTTRESPVPNRIITLRLETKSPLTDS